MPHWLAISFLFLLGASVGSFLNVVVYRLPRIELPVGTGLFKELFLTLRGLSTPPSHCPKCSQRLSWRDNIPVLGWIFLRGKCRYCALPISKRYPTVEFITGLLFAGTYVLVYLFDLGPCAPEMVTINQYGIEVATPGGLNTARDGWLLWLYLPLIACLIAASLIDFELMIIPIWIPWLMAVIGFAVHAIFDRPGLPGSLIQTDVVAMMSLGGAVGIVLSLVLMRFGLLKRSFLEGEPMTKNEQDAVAAGTMTLEGSHYPIKEYTPAETRREILYEVAFLLPPLLLAALAGVLTMRLPAAAEWAATLNGTPHVNGLLGAMLGAQVGAMWVWGTRVLGSIAFGREAMGMGDVHLMFGVGAMLGAAMSSVAFFLAPLPGLLIHLYLVLTDPKRAVPYGPYLSFASILVIFLYCPIEHWLGPGLAGLMIMLRSVF
jgi:leader peptidase (prepilin peptidase) / N-methyltransferase